MRKVAACVNLSLSNVQYHYKTRDELIKGLLSVYIDDFKLMVSEYPANGKEDLKRLIQEILIVESDNDEVKYSTALTSFAEQEEISQYFNEFLSEFYDLFCECLGRISGKDSVNSGIQKAASILVPLVNGYGLASRCISLNPQDLATELSEIVCNFINLKE